MSIMGHPGDTASRIRVPQVLVVGFIFLSVALGYYILSYSSENRDLTEKYNTVMWKLRRSTKTIVNMEMKLKSCKSERESMDQSNAELQGKAAKQEGELANTVKIKEEFEKKYASAIGFYQTVKEIVGMSDGSSLTDDPKLSQYAALKDVLLDWKSDRASYGQIKTTNEETSSKVKELNEKITEQELDNGKLIGQLEEVKEKLSENKKSAESSISSLQQEYDNMKQELEATKQKLTMKKEQVPTHIHAEQPYERRVEREPHRYPTHRIDEATENHRHPTHQVEDITEDHSRPTHRSNHSTEQKKSDEEGERHAANIPALSSPPHTDKNVEDNMKTSETLVSTETPKSDKDGDVRITHSVTANRKDDDSNNEHPTTKSSKDDGDFDDVEIDNNDAGEEDNESKHNDGKSDDNEEEEEEEEGENNDDEDDFTV